MAASMPKTFAWYDDVISKLCENYMAVSLIVFEKIKWAIFPLSRNMLTLMTNFLNVFMHDMAVFLLGIWIW